MADILVIDDQDRYIELCRRSISHHRYLGPARSLQEAQVLLKKGNRIDLVLLDVHFDIPDEQLVGWTEGLSKPKIAGLKRTQGLHILGQLRAHHPELPVVLMTSRDELHLEDSPATDQAEDYTYFLDDDYVDARSLQAQIDGILASRRGRDNDGPVFWGRSLEMGRIRQRLRILARGRLPVVLLGPTGTGKSLLARHYVHANSGRTGRFVSVDLSTVPKELMAAHLFGSVKGAYTGAISDRTGAFEAAHKGTLFLDEVGNLSMGAQKMLLSVLQEGVVSRVGDLRERPVDVKLVVATNEDLAARVRAGDFRADLFMRLNPATAVHLPSLSDRKLDLDTLLRFSLEQALVRPYLQDLMAEYRRVHRLEPGPVSVVCRGPVPPRATGVLVLLFPERSLRLLRAHEWPGNLREFAMVLENAVLFALAEMQDVRGGDRNDVLQVRPKLIRDLLQSSPVSEDDDTVSSDQISVRIEASDTLNKVSVSCEKQYFTQLYLRESGDFAALSTLLLGDPNQARKVQLRFNQLGLRVRDLKSKLP